MLLKNLTWWNGIRLIHDLIQPVPHSYTDVFLHATGRFVVNVPHFVTGWEDSRHLIGSGRTEGSINDYKLLAIEQGLRKWGRAHNPVIASFSPRKAISPSIVDSSLQKITS